MLKTNISSPNHDASTLNQKSDLKRTKIIQIDIIDISESFYSIIRNYIVVRTREKVSKQEESAWLGGNENSRWRIRK